jgi:hypothetical protein
VIADEVVTDVFAVPACDLERDHYGWSCLPAAMGEPPHGRHRAVVRRHAMSARAGEVLDEGADACDVSAHD